LFINNIVSGDSLCERYLPLDAENIYEKLTDGIVLTRLINFVKPGTIDEHYLNTKTDMKIFQKNENLNAVIKAASKIGCHVVNIGALDITEKRPVPVLGLVWQILRIQNLARISFEHHPEIEYLLNPGNLSLSSWSVFVMPFPYACLQARTEACCID
jgi:plastin-1